MFSLYLTFLFRLSELPFLDLACRMGHMVLIFLSGVLVSAWSACLFVCLCVCISGHVCHESHDVCECVTPVLFLSVCMEQCENAASLLASVREQEMQFERLTRALEEERRSVGPSGTLPPPSPHPAGNALPANHAAAGFPASIAHAASLCPPMRPSWHLEEHGD